MPSATRAIKPDTRRREVVEENGSVLIRFVHADHDARCDIAHHERLARDDVAAKMVAREVAERAAFGALLVLGVHVKCRRDRQRRIDTVIDRNAQPTGAIEPPFVSRDVARVRLGGVGVSRREMPRRPR